MKIDVKGMTQKGMMAVRRRSPEILMVLGITGGIGAAVMACVATRRLDPILEEHQRRTEAAKKDEPETGRELAKAYVETGVCVARLYAPSVTVGTLSVICILTGNNILRKRNAALAAAYATISGSFLSYRGRVAERYGEEAERELRTGSHQEKVELIETDENGKEKKVKRTVSIVDSNMPSDYARYFVYKEARAAEPSFDYNLFFLKAQQELANNLLKTRGYLFLNDVYDMLGIDRSLAGQVVGWVYDKNADDHGDNFVDFGIQEVYRKREDAIGGVEKVILLDFNVDGGILDHASSKGLITT